MNQLPERFALQARALLRRWRMLTSGGRLSPRRQGLVCPFSRQRVDCTLIWDAKTQTWAGVHRCSAFSSPSEVTCSGSCVHWKNELLKLERHEYE